MYPLCAYSAQPLPEGIKEAPKALMRSNGSKAHSSYPFAIAPSSHLRSSSCQRFMSAHLPKILASELLNGVDFVAHYGLFKFHT